MLSGFILVEYGGVMLHHVEIYVSDLSKTRKFYDFLLPKLGYKLYQEWQQGFSYKCNAEYIVFVQVRDKYKDVSYNRCHVGLNHLAFKCSSKVLIDEIVDDLKKQNIKMLYNNNHYNEENNYTIFFEDPDRIKLEITCESEI